MGSSPTGGWWLLYGEDCVLPWWLLFCSPSAWGSGQHVPMLSKVWSLYPALNSKGFLGLVNRLTLPMLAMVVLEEESLYNEHTHTCLCVAVHVCLHVCVCMYTCVFSYLYMFMCICVLVIVSVCMHTSVRICNMFIYMCVCVHNACVHVYAFICVCICICTYMCLYMCIHVCLCVYAYVHVCKCVYVCVHISHYSLYSISKNFNQMNNYFSFTLCLKVILIHLDFSFRSIILESSCLVLIEPTLWGPHQVVVIFKVMSSLLSHLISCMADGDWSG